MYNFKNKYLKYKNKYLQLKKQLGSGIDASYTIDKDKLKLEYMDKQGVKKNIIYTIKDEIGRGSFGIVNKLVKDDDGVEFILKKGVTIFDEGHNTESLKDIIDEDMLVLFQGTIPKEFLIAKYNGNNLHKEYLNRKIKIKNEFNSTITQTLQLLSKINKKGFYHNDIKLENITIKNKKVYLIDFGLLDKESIKGNFMSNSIYSITPYKFTEIKSKLKSTDIFGFFYVCIDLLCVNDVDNYSYNRILLNIIGIQTYTLFYNYLFYLYYYILPTDYRTNQEINDNNFVMYLDCKFPTFEESKQIFGEFNPEHTNLFRFMAFIYNNLSNIPDVYKIDINNFINFLRVLSDCLLPDFDYDLFIPKFKAAINLLFQNNLENGFAINSVAFDRSGTLLAIGLDNGTINLWSISVENSSSMLEDTKEMLDHSVTSVVFDPLFLFIVTNYSNLDKTVGIIKLWNISNKKLVEYLIINPCMFVFSVRFNSTGNILAGCSDGTVKLWNIENPSDVHVILDKHSKYAISVEIDQSGTLIASGYDDGIVKLLSLSSDNKSVNFMVNLEKYSEDEKKLIEPEKHSNEYPDAVMSIAFCQIYPIFSTGYNDGNIKIWRILDGHVPSTECVQNLPKHMKPVRSVIFHPKLPYMATCYIDDNIVNIWKISSDSLVNYLSTIELFNKRDYVNSIAFHPKSQILVTGSSDHTAKLWHFL
jgi:WD40 repeat protein